MKAILKNYRQSPRKVRLVVDVIKGKKVADAINALRFVEKRASDPVAKVLQSALANAVQAGASPADLRIAHIAVDKGVTLKRFMPRARGSASRINKRSCHISVTLDNK